MTRTRLDIHLDRIQTNVTALRQLYGKRGIAITAITKGVCGDPEVARALVRGGIRSLGDSRLENLRRMREAGVQAEYMLVRPPPPSRAAEVVALADVSLNSEPEVVRLLAAEAQATGRVHGVILMVEGGDLREGLLPEELPAAVTQIAPLKGIQLRGVGMNLVCLNGVVPTDEAMWALSRLVERTERETGVPLPVVSGGNSGNHLWLMNTQDVRRINHLRIGEAILLGHESVRRQHIEGLAEDAFSLVGEVIEVRCKPSRPRGPRARNAIGLLPERADLGTIRRAIVALGEQDVARGALHPCVDAQIVGISSDVLVLHDRTGRIRVGDEVPFEIDYGTLLRAMTSPYVAKRYHTRRGTMGPLSASRPSGGHAVAH